MTARPSLRPRGLALGAVLAGLSSGAVAALAFLKPTSPGATQPSTARAAAHETQPEPLADWCAPGFEPLAGGDGCFAAPGARAERPLLVYLHGRYPSDGPFDEVDRQRRLGERATARGFAVLVLRGALGACSAPELSNWFCWPSNERNAGAAGGFVDARRRMIATAEERAGSRARFLLGFSNGGYFAGLIASRGLLDVDAVVVAHAGPVEPVHPLGAKPPLLLLSADDDIAQEDMIRFDEELARERWPHDAYARSGGHALTDEDIDAALTFFSRAGEPLPLQPALPLHRAVRHVREAGAGGDDDGSPREDDSASEGTSDPPPSEPADNDEDGAPPGPP
jgi:predicted esterase